MRQMGMTRAVKYTKIMLTQTKIPFYSHPKFRCYQIKDRLPKPMLKEITYLLITAHYCSLALMPKSVLFPRITKQANNTKF